MTRTIVVFSLEPWDGTWRRNQYVIHGLLERIPDAKVVFVEPARDHLHELVTSHRTGRSNGMRHHPDYGGRLLLYQPSKWVPRLAGTLADRLLRAGVRRALHKERIEDAVLWVNDPGWAHAVERHNGPSLYDITDDWLAADRSPRELRRVAANEALLFDRCDAVVVCSRGLVERKRSQRPDVALIPNAVDIARYRQPHARPHDLPAPPTAVYAGTLHEDRLDVELTAATARSLAEIAGTLVLVGPAALSPASRAVLEAEPNLRLLGPREHEQVPAYLQHAEVLVVPHIVDDFTDSLDPIKLYEYLAVSRPIVATAVAGFRDEQSGSAIAIASVEDFGGSVVRTIAHPPPIEAVAVPSWEDRVDAFRTVLEPLFTRTAARRTL